MLEPAEVPLATQHDVMMLDLDGVVYAEGRAIDGAVDGLSGARQLGATLAFITNNASRPPAAVADLLTSMGIPAQTEDVVTSAQAAASVLGREQPAQARVLYVGGEGLRRALDEVGLVPVDDVTDPEVVAVVTGYGPDVVWRDVMVAATRIRDGLPWMATNTDWTIPTAAGVAPGHGVMVKMLSDFTGVRPDVAGKPARPLLEETVERTGATSPLMVGDRLDTDISGARRLGIRSLLVLTGVTDLETLVAAAPEGRPDHLAVDLSGLLESHPRPEPSGDGRQWQVGGWCAQVTGEELEVRGSGDAGDWWRAVAVAGWAHLDRTGRAAGTAGLRPPAPGSVGSDR